MNDSENKKQLREVRVILQRLAPGDKALPFDDPHTGEALGRRTKLGGSPDWIQPAEDTTCPYCKVGMTFIAQIDSIDDHVASGIDYSEAEYMFDDVGMLYVFYCFDCGETATFCQGY